MILETDSEVEPGREVRFVADYKLVSTSHSLEGTKLESPPPSQQGSPATYPTTSHFLRSTANSIPSTPLKPCHPQPPLPIHQRWWPAGSLPPQQHSHNNIKRWWPAGAYPPFQQCKTTASSVPHSTTSHPCNTTTISVQSVPQPSHTTTSLFPHSDADLFDTEKLKPWVHSPVPEDNDDDLLATYFIGSEDEEEPWKQHAVPESSDDELLLGEGPIEAPTPDDDKDMHLPYWKRSRTIVSDAFRREVENGTSETSCSSTLPPFQQLLRKHVEIDDWRSEHCFRHHLPARFLAEEGHRDEQEDDRASERSDSLSVVSDPEDAPFLSYAVWSKWPDVEKSIGTITHAAYSYSSGQLLYCASFTDNHEEWYLAEDVPDHIATPDEVKRHKSKHKPGKKKQQGSNGNQECKTQ